MFWNLNEVIASQFWKLDLLFGPVLKCAIPALSDPHLKLVIPHWMSAALLKHAFITVNSYVHAFLHRRYYMVFCCKSIISVYILQHCNGVTFWFSSQESRSIILRKREDIILNRLRYYITALQFIKVLPLGTPKHTSRPCGQLDDSRRNV